MLKIISIRFCNVFIFYHHCGYRGSPSDDYYFIAVNKRICRIKLLFFQKPVICSWRKLFIKQKNALLLHCNNSSRAATWREEQEGTTKIKSVVTQESSLKLCTP